MNRQQTQLPTKRGFTVIELVVSASLLIAVMTFATTMMFRLDQTWKEIGHQRIAIHELSNQLDRLTTMPIDQVDVAIAAIEPSSSAKRALLKPQLTAERISDADGDRVKLQLKWQTRYPSRGIELVGWLTGKTIAREDQP